MSAAPVSMTKADQASDKGQERLVPPQNGAILFAETTAWWALDISAARATIAAIARGDGPTHWVEALLASVTIADIDENNLHLLGPAGGRARMIGQPFTAHCPPESWQIGAEFILAAVANYPPGALRSRPITSIAFSDGWAEVSTDEAHPDIVYIAVGGTVADDRSFWSVRASEERYRTLIHHLPGALLQVDSRPMTEVAAVYLPWGAAALVTIGAIMAITTSLNPTLIVPSRLAIIFVEDRLAPPWLGFINPRTATPVRALTLTLGASALLLISKQLSLALNIAVFALVLLYFLHSLTFLLLPRWNPKLHQQISIGMPLWLQRAAALLSVISMGALIVVQVVQDVGALRTHSLAERIANHSLTSVELVLVWAAIGAALYAYARFVLGPRTARSR